MLIGRDLGFSYLAVVIVLFCSVIGFVVRRKWLSAMARAEEVKRLLVLASEESARVELEATAGYSTTNYDTESQYLKYQWATTGYSDSVSSSESQKLGFQCAVCFCPTTSRCARCKAVRYCSGECQIIHWRQGHKDDCHPFTTIKQEEDDNYGNTFETEERPKPVEILPEEPAFSSSRRSSILEKNDDIGVENLVSGESRNSASKFTSHSFYKESSGLSAHSESSSGAVSNSNDSNHVSTNQNKPLFSEHPTLATSVDSVTRSVKLNQTKPSCSDRDSQSGSSSSSGWSVDGSNDSTFSEPSTPASGFWEGTLDSTSDSIEVTLPPTDLHCSNLKTTTLEDAGHTNSDIKKPVKEAGSSEGLSKNDSLSSVSGSHPVSSPTRHSTRKDIKKFSSLLPSSPVKSNRLVSDKSSPSWVSKPREVGSLSAKPLDSEDGIQGIAACSSQFNSKNAGNGLKTSMWKVVDQLRASKLSRLGSAVSGRYNYKGLFPYELFVYLYNWKEVELRPCGLINCGNSCYANAVLQCLAFTPPLTAYLLQGLHYQTCEKNDWCFICEFERLILRMKEGTSPLSPVRILSQIQNFGGNLSNGREEDAHEFLRYAIDTMQSVCLKEAGANASASLEEETTLIDLTFGGYLRSKIRCMRCGGKSERNERMMDLTVEIGGDIGTLEEALRQFTGTEILEGENKYQCSRCKSYEKAKKKLTVLEAPNVLTIALKRFQSGKFGKLNKSIRFPEILDLAPYMSETSDTSPIYRLYGVVVHLDIMNAAFSGHYVCYVKNIQNKWFKIDDSKVKPVELERVLSKGAYMLLYARCSPQAPRSIRNSIIPRDLRKTKNPIFKPRSHRTSDFYTDPSSQPIIEEDSSSETSSSFFSESGSCSTETSTRDSTSTDDYFDQILADFGRICNGQSDSDTSSSSSYPSPLYEYRESAADDRGRWPGGQPMRSHEVEGSGIEASVPFSYSERTKHSRKLVNSSCRVAESDRIGQVNPSNIKSGVSFRRSTSERRD
ncbi:hypothetical protein LguiA_004089 [Lonicera macranthoides]